MQRLFLSKRSKSICQKKQLKYYAKYILTAVRATGTPIVPVQS